MLKRALGKTGIHVSEIAFGGVEIGMPYGLGLANPEDMLSENQAIALLHASVDSGIDFFDTARLYGESEVIMGKAFKDRRDQVVIASKCKQFRNREGNLLAEDQLEPFILASLEESLTALQTDYIDIYMLHQADLGILENPIIAAVFQDLKKKGVIRATGASTYSNAETEKAILSGSWDMVQFPFNLLDQRQEALFSLAAEHGTGIVIRSVLLKGLLSEKGKNLHLALSKVETHIEGYQQLLGENYTDLPTLATKFALSFQEISSVLIGMDRMEYLQKALAVADGKYMDDQSLQKARQAAYPEPEFLNLPHWDRMGWL